MKNLIAIYPNDVDSLIDSYQRKINRNQNYKYINKEEIFPKINIKYTKNSFKKRQIEIPMFMNSTTLLSGNNKTRYVYSEPPIKTDKNAKTKRKYNQKDYLLSIKYLRFLKQEDINDDYFDKINTSENDSDDDEKYLIEKLKAKKELKNKLKQISFEKQLEFLMELDNIPKSYIETSAKKIVDLIQKKKKFNSEKNELVIHNIYFDYILFKIYHQIEIRDKYNQKITTENVVNLLQSEVKKTQDKIINYVQEERKKINLKRQNSYDTVETRYNENYNNSSNFTNYQFNTFNKNDYITFIKLKKKYGKNLNIQNLEQLENLDERKDEMGKMDQLILEQFIKKKGKGNIRSFNNNIYSNNKSINNTKIPDSTFDKSETSNNIFNSNTNTFLRLTKRNLEQKKESKDNLMNTFNSLLYPSKNTNKNNKKGESWLSNQNTFTNSLFEDTKRTTTNTNNYRTGMTTFDENFKGKTNDNNFFVVDDNEEYGKKKKQRKLNDIIKDKISFNDEKKRKKKKKKQFNDDENEDNEIENIDNNEENLYGEKVLKRGKRKHKKKKKKGEKDEDENENDNNNKENQNEDEDNEEIDSSELENEIIDENGTIIKKKSKSKSKSKKKLINIGENEKNNIENNENINSDNLNDNNMNIINNEDNNENINIKDGNINVSNIKKRQSINRTPNRRVSSNIFQIKTKPSTTILQTKEEDSSDLFSDNEEIIHKDNKKIKLEKKKDKELEREKEKEKEKEREKERERAKKKKIEEYLKMQKQSSSSIPHYSFNPYLSDKKQLTSREQNEFLRKLFFKKSKKLNEKYGIFIDENDNLENRKEEDIIKENKRLIKIGMGMGDEDLRKFIFDNTYLFNNKGSAYYDIKQDIYSLLETGYDKKEESSESETEIKKPFFKKKKKKKKIPKQYVFEKSGLKLVLNFDLNKLYDEKSDEEDDMIKRKKRIEEEEEERKKEMTYEERLKRFFEKIQRLKNDEGYANFEKELDELIKEQIEESDMGKNKKREANLRNFSENLELLQKERSNNRLIKGNLIYRSPCEFETLKKKN